MSILNPLTPLSPTPADETPARTPDNGEAINVLPIPNEEEIKRITTDVVEQIKTVYDPEIPVDVYELGLIYKVILEDDRNLIVDMTLTAPGCPVAGEMPIWVRDACQRVKGVNNVHVNMVFDPPWTPDLMSDEAKLELNML